MNLSVHPVIRTEAMELQNKNIIILRGVHESDPRICAAGWSEDQDASDDGDPVTLHEPIYFAFSGNGDEQKGYEYVFIQPEHGVPVCAKFHDYTKLEIYEGVSDLGVLYIKALLKLRDLGRPKYMIPKFAAFTSLQPKRQEKQ